MRKMKLDLDKLVVAGFETEQSGATARGTVQGNSVSFLLCEETFGCTGLDCLSEVVDCLLTEVVDCLSVLTRC